MEETIPKKLDALLFFLGIATVLEVGGIGGEIINGYRNRRNLYSCREYQTQGEARKDLEEEKRKIGLEAEVEMYFRDNLEEQIKVGNENVSMAWKIEIPNTAAAFVEEGRYNIYLGTMRNKRALRHELYHLKQIEEGKDIPRCLLIPLCVGNPFHQIEEWNATSYAIKENC